MDRRTETKWALGIGDGKEYFLAVLAFPSAFDEQQLLLLRGANIPLCEIEEGSVDVKEPDLAPLPLHRSVEDRSGDSESDHQCGQVHS